KPPQARAILRNDFRLHITPGRDTDKLFLLRERSKIELLERATVPRSGAIPQADAPAEEASPEKAEETKAAGKTKAAKSKSKPAKAKKTEEMLPDVAMDDWWLARDDQ